MRGSSARIPGSVREDVELITEAIDKLPDVVTAADLGL